VIIEMLANVNLPSDLELLAPRGCVVIVGSRGTTEIDPRQLMHKTARMAGVFAFTALERRQAHLAIGAGLSHRTLRPVVGRRYPLHEAAAAHHAVMSPGARGKVVLVMG